MPDNRIILRDERGVDHDVVVGANGSVSIDNQMVAVVPTRSGEVRAGTRVVWAIADGDLRWVFADGQVHTFEVLKPGGSVRAHARHHDGLSAPMPATVVKINVSTGDTVHAGDVLIVLEAMKMELPVRAGGDGIVTHVRCREGELVPPGRPLIEILAKETT
jgi:biotin carboxyl carrier protein